MSDHPQNLLREDYLSMDDATSAVVKELAQERRWGAVQSVLTEYGRFLQEYPGAFDHIEVHPTARTFGPLSETR